MKSPHEKVQSHLDRLAARIYKQPVYHYPGQKYHFVFGFTHEGKKVCLGPFTDASEADGKLAELEDGEVFALTTRDPSRAVREIRAILMSRGEDADGALRRMLHEKGLAREQKYGR